MRQPCLGGSRLFAGDPPPSGRKQTQAPRTMTQPSRPRYLRPLDEEALFRDGAAAFRLDVETTAALRAVIAAVAWEMPAGDAAVEAEVAAVSPERPVAVITEEIAAARE